jgi:hypothetical protein
MKFEDIEIDFEAIEQNLDDHEINYLLYDTTQFRINCVSTANLDWDYGLSHYLDFNTRMYMSCSDYRNLTDNAVWTFFGLGKTQSMI